MLARGAQDHDVGDDLYVSEKLIHRWKVEMHVWIHSCKSLGYTTLRNEILLKNENIQKNDGSLRSTEKRVNFYLGTNFRCEISFFHGKLRHSFTY